MAPTWAAPIEPAVNAAAITPCCAGPLGAVRLLDRPSWLTAVPTRTPTAVDAPPTALGVRAAGIGSRLQKGGKWAEGDQAAELSAHIAICGGIKGLAAAICRKHACLLEHGRGTGQQHRIDATRQGLLQQHLH